MGVEAGEALMEGLELIECRPYEARITARVCALRRVKAEEVRDRYGLPPASVQKCVECPDAREPEPGSVCATRGCPRPATRKGGHCGKHGDRERHLARILDAREGRDERRKVKEAKVAKKTKTCIACKRSIGPEERAYAGKCPDCRAPKGKAKKAALEPVRPATVDSDNEAAAAIRAECRGIEALLLDKNRKYGNSALEPVRTFSRADPIEQLNVRIDDKLSRIQSGQADDDEDVELDLIGYLVLRRIARRKP